MIVVESAREHLEVGFWDYARFGIPIAILTTAAGVVVLLDRLSVFATDPARSLSLYR